MVCTDTPQVILRRVTKVGILVDGRRYAAPELMAHIGDIVGLVRDEALPQALRLCRTGTLILPTMPERAP